MTHGRIVRTVAGAVIAGLLASTMPVPVQARVVSTEEALAATPASDRAALEALLARDDVRARLEALGVDPQQAVERVQALDDQQARELAARIDELPAGAGIVGAILTIFIVLLITDILGFTKVYPFTRSIR
ncbi:MAG: PA2779 family protein [Burkholderiaceae bacterium]|nr:PA2779 family protein [Burkholderiaceae bacterium]ODS98240.1 MAG: hypothetical protein ABS56_06500 [Lautropia sp. SCN 69-89]